MKWSYQYTRIIRLIFLLVVVSMSFMLSIILPDCHLYRIEFERENSNINDFQLASKSQCNELFCPIHELEQQEDKDSVGTLSLLSKKYVSIELVVRDISKYLLNDIYVIEVVFSAALVPEQDFSNYIKLLDINYHPIAGEWQMLDNYMGVVFYGAVPSTNLYLSIDVGLMGLNGLILAEQQFYQLTPSLNSKHYLVVSSLS